MDKRNDAIEYCSKCLFTASENIRECLDSLELELQNTALCIADTYELEICRQSTERLAKRLQKLIKR